jgi:hypothetical protein
MVGRPPAWLARQARLRAAEGPSPTGGFLQSIIANASLETLVTDPSFFGLTTASPVQRAICRVIDGEPLAELGEDEAVRRAFSGVLPTERPAEVVWLSAIRSAKSLIAAACCVRWSQTADVSQLGPGEVPRIPVLSLDKDKAQAVLNHLVGRTKASPLLSTIVIGDSAEGVMLRHPSGRAVEARVVAGKRAGSAVVAYWLAGCVFDEFPRMHGADDAVVNWEETRNSALDRILNGGQIVNIGSPWAPFGPAHEMVTEHAGKPTRSVCVARSPGWDTNPAWWTPERVNLARTRNPNFRTDVAAEFASPEESLIPSEHVDRSVRVEPEMLPRVEGADYAAAMDPATRGNGWTFVLVTKEGQRLRVVTAREWIGTSDAPLSPAAVLDEIVALCRVYGVDSAETDQHMGDALVSLAAERDFALVRRTLTERQRVARYLAIRTRFALGHVELAPSAGDHLRVDMLRLRKRVTQAGIAVDLPATPDGRHCDYAPAMMLALSRYLDDVAEASESDTVRTVREMREWAARRYLPRRGGDDEESEDDDG